MQRTNSQINRSSKVRTLVLTGLFSALIYVFTAYLHVPTGAGYTHAGDGLIYLAGSILPAPYAAAAGAIGGGLADGLTGFAVWMPATIVIKMITALFFSNRSKNIITLRIKPSTDENKNRCIIEPNHQYVKTSNCTVDKVVCMQVVYINRKSPRTEKP